MSFGWTFLRIAAFAPSIFEIRRSTPGELLVSRVVPRIQGARALPPLGSRESRAIQDVDRLRVQVPPAARTDDLRATGGDAEIGALGVGGSERSAHGHAKVVGDRRIRRRDGERVIRRDAQADGSARRHPKLGEPERALLLPELNDVRELDLVLGRSGRVAQDERGRTIERLLEAESVGTGAAGGLDPDVTLRTGRAGLRSRARRSRPPRRDSGRDRAGRRTRPATSGPRGPRRTGTAGPPRACRRKDRSPSRSSRA